MVRLHPYEAVYFNRTVGGGLSGAHGRFETDYWGHSFKEGVRWLVANAEPSEKPWRVGSSCFPTQVSLLLPADRFEYVGTVDHGELEKHPYRDPPDYNVATTRWGHHEKYPGEVVHRIERDDVPLLVVVRVDREEAKNRGPL